MRESYAPATRCAGKAPAEVSARPMPELRSRCVEGLEHPSPGREPDHLGRGDLGGSRHPHVCEGRGSDAHATMMFRRVAERDPRNTIWDKARSSDYALWTHVLGFLSVCTALDFVACRYVAAVAVGVAAVHRPDLHETDAFVGGAPRRFTLGDRRDVEGDAINDPCEANVFRVDAFAE